MSWPVDGELRQAKQETATVRFTGGERQRRGGK
jgi:hypothetical protein